VKVLVVDPDSSQVMVTLTDTATLAVGGILTNHQPLATAGLASKTYLVLLQVTVAGTAQTLATTTVTIVNAPPDCSKARASIAELFPPNHKLVRVSVESVTDPDGDPLAITVNQVRQDEPTNALGDGNTCPDAVGTGTSTVSVRAERSGQGDGRVYHLLFVAADGRGGTCGGEVTVCVPHDQGRSGGSCVDQGPVFDSTACTSLAGSDPERH
jgi:hypothetical protein